MKYKIITDSSCDLDINYLNKTEIDFSIIPLIINIDGQDFVDDNNLNVINMLNAVDNYKGKSTSSCPSPTNFFEQLNGADRYFIITISSKLSGSYNSAMLAKNMFRNPENVCIIDSKATSGSMVLIIDKIVSLINQEYSFEDICKIVTNYAENEIGLMFALNKFDNLVKNGRISSTKAMIASMLQVKPLCQADDGEIQVYKKIIGFKKIFKEIVITLTSKLKNSTNKTCVISHCQNEEMALYLKNEFKKANLFDKIKLIPMKGLCSFYALQKGIIVSYEM